MTGAELFGAWVAVFLTLAIMSFLYKDNPFYKVAEHLFVGISAGYWASMAFWTQIQPNLIGRLWPAQHPPLEGHFLLRLWYGIYKIFSFFHSGIFPPGGVAKGHELDLLYLIPLVLGIFMLFRLWPRVGWLARWSMAYVVGLAAGLRLYGFLNSNILAQIRGTALPLFHDPWTTFNSLVIIIGTLTGLFYFFFSKEHTGVFGTISRIGIWFLMISFGASFGFAVMARISLLIGRFQDLIQFGSDQYHHATFWILGIIVAILGYSAIKEHQAKRKTATSSVD